ncbi:MAG: hypothetical protein FJ088_14010, partial [Deltaproteobacteria bacterium]|nr:hypothetical protein [Deltaproteobacteria bacterium]
GDALLDALKFPRVAAKVNPGSVLDFAGKDKKNRSGAIRFSLPSVIGKMCENNGLWTVEVKEREILRALEKICSA